MTPNINQIFVGILIFLSLLAISQIIITPQFYILDRILWTVTLIISILTAIFLTIINEKKSQKTFSHRFGDPKRCDMCYCKIELKECKNCGKMLCTDCMKHHTKSIGMKCP